MNRLPLFVGLVGLLALEAPIEAEEFRWLALGDSITLGNYDFDNKGGYPGRLDNLLNCSPGNCEVVNKGKSGEKTYQAVTRIDSVLNNNGPFDVMLLMEGTNDIFSNLSAESVKNNLKTIANKATNHGVETVHGSIIWFHPDGEHGTSKNSAVKAVRDKVASLAQSNDRYFVDIWDELCPNSHTDRHGHSQSACFSQHYSDTCPGRPPPCGDNRGHPIGSGYDMMASRWYESITAANVPAKPVTVSPSGTVLVDQLVLIWETANRANWYRLLVQTSSGSDIDVMLEASTFCDNGECRYAISGLQNGDHTWKVRGRSPRGWGSWSNTQSIPFPSSFFGDGFESGNTSGWPGISP